MVQGILSFKKTKYYNQKKKTDIKYRVNAQIMKYSLFGSLQNELKDSAVLFGLCYYKILLATGRIITGETLKSNESVCSAVAK
jgi:hypothetical protein